MCLTIAALLPSFSLLPILVFLAELCVVTLSTLRIIFIARQCAVLAPLVGFFEVAIWLFAIGQVMQNLHDAGCFLGFAGGFTLGNFLGMVIESWLALGTVVVRTITHRDATALLESLQQAQFGVTCMDAQGSKGPVKVVFTVVRRKELAVALEAYPTLRSQGVLIPWTTSRTPNPASSRSAKRLRGAIPDILQSFRKAA